MDGFQPAVQAHADQRPIDVVKQHLFTLLDSDRILIDVDPVVIVENNAELAGKFAYDVAGGCTVIEKSLGTSLPKSRKAVGKVGIHLHLGFRDSAQNQGLELVTLACGDDLTVQILVLQVGGARLDDRREIRVAVGQSEIDDLSARLEHAELTDDDVDAA